MSKKEMYNDIVKQFKQLGYSQDVFSREFNIFSEGYFAGSKYCLDKMKEKLPNE